MKWLALLVQQLQLREHEGRDHDPLPPPRRSNQCREQRLHTTFLGEEAAAPSSAGAQSLVRRACGAASRSPLCASRRRRGAADWPSLVFVLPFPRRARLLPPALVAAQSRQPITHVPAAPGATFASFGGVPRELLFEQLEASCLKTVASRVERVLEHSEVPLFAAHWGFRILLYRPGAQTKGSRPTGARRSSELPIRCGRSRSEPSARWSAYSQHGRDRCGRRATTKPRVETRRVHRSGRPSRRGRTSSKRCWPDSCKRQGTGTTDWA